MSGSPTVGSNSPTAGSPTELSPPPALPAVPPTGAAPADQSEKNTAVAVPVGPPNADAHPVVPDPGADPNKISVCNSASSSSSSSTTSPAVSSKGIISATEPKPAPPAADAALANTAISKASSAAAASRSSTPDSVTSDSKLNTVGDGYKSDTIMCVDRCARMGIPPAIIANWMGFNEQQCQNAEGQLDKAKRGEVYLLHVRVAQLRTCADVARRLMHEKNTEFSSIPEKELNRALEAHHVFLREEPSMLKLRATMLIATAKANNTNELVISSRLGFPGTDNAATAATNIQSVKEGRAHVLAGRLHYFMYRTSIA